MLRSQLNAAKEQYDKERDEWRVKEAKLTGSVFVDLYFSTGGLGQAYVNSALTRDYAVLLGVTILYGALTVIVNLVTDLAYAWFDPKIRY